MSDDETGRSEEEESWRRRGGGETIRTTCVILDVLLAFRVVDRAENDVHFFERAAFCLWDEPTCANIVSKHAQESVRRSGKGTTHRAKTACAPMLMVPKRKNIL